MNKATRVIARFWEQHGEPVTVEPYEGEGHHGPSYGSALIREVWRSDEQRTVSGPDGTTVLATSVLYGPLEYAEDFPPRSLVRFQDGTSGIVQARQVFAARGGPFPEHIEVSV